MKVACLLVPHLPVQVERQRDPSLADVPLIVGGRPWDPGAVLDCCPQAAVTGVMPGMRLSQAETLCPTARFVPAHEDSYRAVHDALVAAAEYFTPTVEIAGLGVLYAEVSGLGRRFGPDFRLARRMALEAEQALSLCPGCDTSLDVRIGLGSSKFVAEQAACAAWSEGGYVVPPGEERAFLSPLLLSVLPIDPEMHRRLSLLGVRTLGALTALPRPAVVRQFGPQAGLMHNLARGVDSRSVRADAAPLVLEQTCTFSDPIDDRAILLSQASRMAAKLAGALSRCGYQAEGLRLCLEDDQGKEITLGAQVKPPSANEGKLSRLAGRLLEELTPAQPITAFSLVVYPLRPFHLGATQLALFPDVSLRSLSFAQGKRLEQLREALRRLRVRFGEMVIVIASMIKPPSPRPIQVMTGPQGRPRALILRLRSGLVWQDHIREVVAIYETWRECTRWWSWPVERDYFRVETDDGRVRVVFRDMRAGQWLIERCHI